MLRRKLIYDRTEFDIEEETELHEKAVLVMNVILFGELVAWSTQEQSTFNGARLHVP